MNSSSKSVSQPEFLPMSKAELEALGISKPDIIIVSGDAYVDHPSFATALLGRVLFDAGFTVAVIAQPDWKDKSFADFQIFGEPNLFFMIAPGAVDPMVNSFTPALKRRSEDAYSPGGKPKRPDRTTIVYTNALHRVYPKTPIIIGGVEASLRRFAHYDYWSDSVRQGILADAPASLLVYGMGELSLIEIAERLSKGEQITDLKDIPGTGYTISLAEFRSNPLDNAVILPSYPEVLDKELFAKAFSLMQNPAGNVIIQPHPKTVVVMNPQSRPLTESELDRIYELPFARDQHPSYTETIPALTPIQFSLVTHRGCYGACSFCAITHHQGRVITSRSIDSVLREAERMTKMPEFRGTISDVGGPSANMYKNFCKNWEADGPCKDKLCTTCPSMESGILSELELLRKLRKLPKVNHVFISSGIRYDLIPENEAGDVYLKEISQHHISGHLKVAPEHISTRVTNLMHKPDKAVFERFRQRFEKLQKDKPKRQYLLPYLMSSHPGCRVEDMIELALYLKEHKMYTEQVQDFTPVPMTLSTAMYYSGLNPETGKKVYVPLGGEKRAQRALLQWKNPKMYEYVVSALMKAGRSDLIGGQDGLVPGKRVQRYKKYDKRKRS